MLDKQTRGAILRLSSKGQGTRSISRLLSVSRETTTKVIRSGSDEVSRIRRTNKTDRYHAQIIQLISEHGGNNLKVYDALCAAGAKLSYSTLTRFCRLNRPHPM